MDWQVMHRRLLDGLSSELRGRWGRISEIEEHLGLSGGYLNKLCKGKHDFKLKAFLKTLTTVGLDPRAFFSRMLEIRPEPGDYLKQLEDDGAPDRAHSRIAQAARELEGAEPPIKHPRAKAGAECVAEFAACPQTEQRRRLRSTRRYRTHAFAQAYLDPKQAHLVSAGSA